jgi:alpha-ketoglutarate-dependent taurine dioxygenase
MPANARARAPAGDIAMLDIRPTGHALGATIDGVDLSRALTDREFGATLGALGRYGVLCFPGQQLDTAALKAFAGRFGELEVNVAGAFQDPVHPEVMILSNIKENGHPIGLADAGQDWHTDMSYSSTIAFANVLYALKVPRRNGRPLGATEFAGMHAAYDGLPADLKTRLAGATILHDFAKFWDKMRAQPGSTRPPLTEEQRRRKPPVSHPVFLTHPITGRKIYTPIRATRCASTSSQRPRATRCSSSCSRISCSRNTATLINGPSATS